MKPQGERGDVRKKEHGGRRDGEEKAEDGAADCRVNFVIQGFTAVRSSLEGEGERAVGL